MKKMIVILFAIVLMFNIGCSSNQQIAQKNIPQLIDEDVSTPVQDISIKAVLGTFTPNQITVKKGVPVRLKITAEEIDPKFEEHGFAIKELDIDEKIRINETKIIEFTPDLAGSFVFYCSVYCGQGHMGQTGIIQVIE